MMCDFCCAREEVTERFDARDAIVPTPAIMAHVPVEHHSEGGWAACRECAKLVNANDRGALAKRAIEMFMSMMDIPASHRSAIEVMLTAAHETFWRNRT